MPALFFAWPISLLRRGTPSEFIIFERMLEHAGFVPAYPAYAFRMSDHPDIGGKIRVGRRRSTRGAQPWRFWRGARVFKPMAADDGVPAAPGRFFGIGLTRNFSRFCVPF
jgi:hypothetical protein